MRELRWAVEVCRSVSEDLALPLTELATAPLVPPAATAAVPPAAAATAVVPRAAQVPAVVLLAVTASSADELPADDDTSWFFEPEAEPPATAAPQATHDSAPQAAAAAAAAERAAAEVLDLKERGNEMLKQGQLRAALSLYASACAAYERERGGTGGDAETLAVILSNSSLARYSPSP